MALISYVINLLTIGYCLFAGGVNAALVGVLLAYSGLMNYDVVLCAFSYSNLELKMISLERLINFVKIEPESGYL